LNHPSPYQTRRTPDPHINNLLTVNVNVTIQLVGM
jgi:hypothetical protein